MYYPEDLVEEVRTRNNIVDVIGSYVRLQKKGSSYFGLCPFHSEKSPSFSVSPNKQMYYCFGCGVGGNVITFLMEYENYTFPEALKVLAERAGVALPEAELTDEEKRNNNTRHVLLDIHKDAAMFYYKALYTPYGKNALDYLTNRGLSPETIRQFGLGFAPSTSDSLYNYLKKKGYSDQDMKASGIFRFSEKGPYDIFWNRVMYPIMDVNNKVIAFGGRVMGKGEPKYLNSPETKIFDKSRNLYGLHAAKKSRRDYFLICEGYMDVISLHQAGFTNAVAALGTAFTSNHCSVIRRYVKKVVLTFDSDGAGIKAALRAIPILRTGGLEISVLTMKPYKDPDEFIKALGPEEYQKRIDAAQNAFLFEVTCLREKYNLSDPADKTNFVDEVAKMLLIFEDEIERTNYMEAVCKQEKIDYADMKKKVNKLGSRIVPGANNSYDAPRANNRTKEKEEGAAKTERLLLTWISEEPKVYSKIEGIIDPSDFSSELYRKVAERIFEQAKEGSVNPGQIISSFINDEEDYKKASALFQMDRPKEMNSLDKSKAFTEAVKRIKKSSLEKKGASADPSELMNIIIAKRKLETLKITLE
ncbi:MAG: DNA primase [Lachnospiraceae bacterium]|nr:DNA primase [Lachnospiraceae bacterium]